MMITGSRQGLKNSRIEGKVRNLTALPDAAGECFSNTDQKLNSLNQIIADSFGLFTLLRYIQFMSGLINILR